MGYDHLDPDLLSAYLDAEVTPAERAEVEAHLLSCDNCRRELESLRWTVDLLRRMPPVELPRTFYLTADAVEPAAAQQTRRWPGWLQPLLAFSTAVSAVLFVVLTLTSLSGGVGAPAAMPAVEPARLAESPAALAQPGIAAETLAATEAAASAFAPEAAPAATPEMDTAMTEEAEAPAAVQVAPSATFEPAGTPSLDRENTEAGAQSGGEPAQTAVGSPPSEAEGVSTMMSAAPTETTISPDEPVTQMTEKTAPVGEPAPREPDRSQETPRQLSGLAALFGLLTLVLGGITLWMRRRS